MYSNDMCWLYRLLVVVVAGSASLVWWQVLIMDIDRCSLGVVGGILLERWSILVLKRVRNRRCGVVCGDILTALGSLLRFPVADDGVDEKTEESETVTR